MFGQPGLRRIPFLGHITNINPRGAWSALGEYEVADTVDHLGTSYICVVAVGPSVTAPPDDHGNWGVLAAKGNTGATGADGAATDLPVVIITSEDTNTAEAPYEMLGVDRIVRSTRDAVTYVKLPEPAAGRLVYFIGSDGGEPSMLISVFDAELIYDRVGDSDSTFSFSSSPRAVSLLCDGTDWHQVG